MTKPCKNLKPGDRIAYAAKFLRNTGQFSGSAPQRRGTFVSYWDANPDFARVHWDDFDAAYHEKQNGADYVEDCLANGQLVHAGNIAKVGSARFASNDI